MEKTKNLSNTIKVTTILLASSIGFNSYAKTEDTNFVDEIEIKGLSLKKTKEEVLKDTVNFAETPYGRIVPKDGFTVAGLEVKYPSILFSSTTNELVEFSFSFSSNGFEMIRTAIKTKYPKMTCKDFEISNGMGAKFQQTECELREPLGVMRISRYGSKITSGRFSLTKSATKAEQKQQIEKNLKDL